MFQIHFGLQIAVISHALLPLLAQPLCLTINWPENKHSDGAGEV